MIMRKAPPSNQELAASAGAWQLTGCTEMDLDMDPMVMDDITQTGKSSRARYLHLLSQLLLGAPFAEGSSASALVPELRMLSNLYDYEVSRFLAFADLHQSWSARSRRCKVPPWAP